MEDNRTADVEKQPIQTETSTAVPSSKDGMGPPPSYDSIYGKLKAERQKTSDHSTFFANSCSIVGQSVGCTVFLAVTLVLPIAMIVIGALNLNKCQIQRFIPIWLVVAGSTSALLQLLNLCQNRARIRQQNDHENIDGAGSGKTGSGGPNGILGCFNFAWFIAGNVWVFSVSDIQYTNNLLPNYCDQLTYQLAFYSIIAAYIMIGLMCFCGCCVCAALGRETTKQ